MTTTEFRPSDRERPTSSPAREDIGYTTEPVDQVTAAQIRAINSGKRIIALSEVGEMPSSLVDDVHPDEAPPLNEIQRQLHPELERDRVKAILDRTRKKLQSGSTEQ